MTRAEADKRIRQLSEQIAEHDHRYYVLDKPSVSDAAYDKLFRELKELEDKHPDLKRPDSPTMRVSGGLRAGFRKVRHVTPMLSLDSLMEPDDVREFDARARRILEVDAIGYVAEPKFDGLSVELLYEESRARTSPRTCARSVRSRCGCAPDRSTGRRAESRCAARR